MNKSIALTDAKNRRRMIFSSPPWRLRNLKRGVGDCRVSLVHEDGATRSIVTSAEEKAVRACLSGG